MSAQEREALADVLTGQTVRVQVPNVGTMTGFLRRESGEYLANLLASPVREPGRSEAEIKAEALREAVLDPRVWPGLMSRILLDLATEILADQVTDTEGQD